MHIALFCPFSLGPTRGNITTVRRIAKHLRQLDYQISLITLDTPDRSEQLQRLATSSPDLLHAFHAYHAGPVTRATAHTLKTPYLITLTGSDLFDPALRDHPATGLAITDAAAVTCFDPLVAEQAVRCFPGISHKLTVIHQGVEPHPVIPLCTRADSTLVILLPAALRPVKGIETALEQLSPLATRLPHLQLWIAGGIIDPGYAETIRAKSASLPWVKLLGEVPYQAMGSCYASADLILNSSQFEGGMANALLEAMVLAKPVLAHNIPGNRSLIKHGETGWLYTNGEELRQLVTTLAQQPDQRKRVGRAAQQQVLKDFSPTEEAASLAALYHQIYP